MSGQDPFEYRLILGETVERAKDANPWAYRLILGETAEGMAQEAEIEARRLAMPRADVELLRIREGVERLVEIVAAEPEALPLPTVAELASLASLNRDKAGKPDFAAAWDVWLVAVEQVRAGRAGADGDPMASALMRAAEAEDALLEWGSEEMAKIVGGRYLEIVDVVSRGEGIFDSFEKRVRADFPDGAQTILARYHGARGKRPGIHRSMFLRYWTEESGVARRKMEREQRLARVRQLRRRRKISSEGSGLSGGAAYEGAASAKCL